MEAAPRLPMVCFQLKTSTEKVSFGSKLKQYIASFYHEDAESYNNEIYKLESLRAAAVHPSDDVSSCQVLKEYYCQLHFLKSRFPMEENQPAAVFYSWKDNYTNVSCSVPDINFELMCILYNIGALHSQLGAADARSSSDGMKMSCTHFQCAAWAFQTLRETYPQYIALHDSIEVVHAMQLISLAQAQECILEKSMLDNRKATIIAKVAVQVVDYYKQALTTLQAARDDSDFIRTEKYTLKYLAFKCEYHRSIALLYQGQQSEEQQKMGERVAFYQAALEYYEEARKLASNMSSSWAAPFKEALAFTLDVIEGKRKAAKNENEFIYHEEVPDRDTLQEIKGASLVKGIPFSVNDVEVSGPDIFARLVPMEAHEASSLYSEQKAQMLRQIGELVESKDQSLAEFMSSLQLDVLSQMHQARGLPQELIDRAAALSARPTACQDLVGVMAKLSNSYHDVEAMLNDIQELLKEEEHKEKEYQTIMGKRPPSIIATDLSREAAKYQEAHGKASESNQNLHRAMTAHVANIKVLAMPLAQLQQQIPSIEFPNQNVDEKVLRDIETLVGKVDEMKAQRSMLWGQLREGVHKDDITGVLVTRQPEQSLDQLFQQELEKHRKTAALIEQNVVAQDNILKALVDTYAQFSNSRKYLQDVLNKRNLMLTNLIGSYDTYDDLLAKANKGIEFYNKLETNVSKLLQRIKSACKVQDEEREQILLKNNQLKPEVIAPSTVSRAPKLKDYLDSMKGDKISGMSADKMSFQAPVYQPVGTDTQHWPPAVRPAPVGSEINSDAPVTVRAENRLNYGAGHMSYGSHGSFGQAYNSPIVYTYSHQYDQPISNTGHGGATSQGGSAVYPDSAAQPSSQSVAQPSGQQAGHGTQSQTAAQPSSQIVVQPSGQQAGYGLQQGTLGYSYNNAAATNYDDRYNAPAGYVPPSGYVQPNNHIQSTGYAHPTVQGSYVQPASQDSYGQPTSQSRYVQPAQTGYTKPAQTPQVDPSNQNLYNQTGYNQGLSQMAYGIAGKQEEYSYVQPTSNLSQSTDTNYSHTAYQNPTNQSDYSQSTNQQVNYSQPSNQVGSAQSIGQTGTADKNIDQTLSERMAALVASKEKSAGSYVPGQYSQFGYGSQNYNHATNYLYATPTMQNVSNYQTVSSTNYPYVTTSEQCTAEPNTYNAADSSANKASAYYSTYAATGGGYQVDPTSQGVSALNVQGETNTYNITPYVAPTNTFAINPYSQYPQTITNTDIPAQPASSYNNYPQQQAGADYYNYYGSYPAANSTQQATTQVSTSTGLQNQIPEQKSGVKKESSIDLLSGLDFNISHAPLVPQQKSHSSSEKNEVSTSKPVETPQPLSNRVAAKAEGKTMEAVSEKIKTERPKVDPFQSAEAVKQFVIEVEKYEKFFDSLITKTLNGPTTLDLKWKEIQDRQDNENYNKSISVARCYPLKNRFPDILPYDYSRVELKTTKDDYVNASFVKDASANCPTFIVTQAPTSSTFSEFWALVWEQNIEIIVCLLNNNELAGDIYWPKEIGKDMTMTDKVISLVSTTTKDHWTERRMSVSIPEQRKVKTLLHLQFTSWPGSLIPTSPVGFVNFTKETLTQYDQQNMSHPILVHCAAGVGRSGLFCVLLTAILEVMINPNSLPDIPLIAGKMSCKRKNVLRDREHLKFAYTAFLYYLKELQSRYTKPESTAASGHSRKASTSSLNIPPVIEDPFSSLDPLWATKRNA